MPSDDDRYAHTPSLKDLVQHAPDQEKRIELVFAAGELERKLGGRGAFKYAGKAWEDVWTSSWGVGLYFFDTEEAEFDRGDDLVDDFSIESEDPYNPPPDPQSPPSEPTFDIVSSSRRVMKIPPTFHNASGERTSRMLIRTEYDTAEKAALSAQGAGARVFLVTGQPGSGITLCLFRLLIKRLSLKLPTVLQLLPNRVIIFHSKGVYEFEQPDNPGPYAKLDPGSSNPYQTIWALFDSNTALAQPSGVFTENSPFFVLEASSDHNNRLEWLKTAIPRLLYMKAWSFPEVAQARTLINPVNPPTEQQLWHLYKTYGASCRHLFECATDPERYQALVQSAVESVDDLLHALTRPSAITATSHLVVLLEPSPRDRSSCQVKIITRAVLEMVWRRHLEHKASRARDFYELFLEHSSMATSAGLMFEFRIHQLLRRGQCIEVFRVNANSDVLSHVYSDYQATIDRDPEESLSFELPPSGENLLHSGITSLVVGRYYRLASSTFDSLILLEPDWSNHHVLLIFRITRNKTNLDVKQEGLVQVKKLNLPNRTKMYYVAITPEGLHPVITIDRDCLDVIGKGNPENVLPVYHYPVNQSRLFNVPGKERLRV